MATVKPRVNITLSDDSYLVFKSYADALGTQTGSVISKILTELVPTIRVMAAVAESAKALQASSHQAFIDQLSDVDGLVTFTKDNALFDLAMLADNPPLPRAEEVRRGEGKVADFSAKQSINPLAINKGVRSTVRREIDQKKNKSKMWLATTSDAG